MVSSRNHDKGTHPESDHQVAIFQALVNNAADAIVVAGLDGRMSYNNRTCYDFLGYDYEAQELIGLELAALLPQEESEQLLQGVLFQAMAGEWRGEVQLKRKDGSLLDVSVTAFSIPDGQGQPVSVAAIIRDISERKRLDREREAAYERRARQVQLATEVAQDIATALALDELYRRVVTLVKERFGYYHAQIFRYDSKLNAMRVVKGYGQVGEKMEANGHHLPYGRGVVGMAAATGQPVLAADVSLDPHWVPHPDLPDTKGELAVPIVLHGEVLGVLDVQSDKVNALTGEDQTVLAGLAGQMASAIESTRLLEQMQVARQQAEVRVREMQILHRMSQAISGTLDLNHVLDSLVNVLSQEMGYTYITVGLIDEPANEWRTMRAFGLAEGLSGRVSSLDQMQDDIVMDVARRGQIEIIDGWDDRLDREIYERDGHAALVRAYVPLLLRAKPIGVLEVGYQRDARPVITDEEIRLLRGLTDQLAVAIENARLFEQTQARAERERIIHEISGRMQRATDMEALMRITAEELSRALGGSRVYVHLGTEVEPGGVSNESMDEE